MKSRVVALGILLSLASAARANESAVGRHVDSVALRDFRGRRHDLFGDGQAKVIVLAFLGTECPLAKLYGPRLAALAKQFGDEVRVVGINANVQDSISEIAAYARIHEIDFPLLKDVGNQVADAVGAVRTPEVFVLDSTHVVRYWGRIDDQFGVGVVRDEPRHHYLKDAVSSLLTGEAIETTAVDSVGCHIGRVKTPKPNAPVTYTNQISRILQKRCVECHRDGDIAPFQLTDYAEVVGWAEMIEEVVRERRMPPWHADPAHGRFDDDRSLTKQEREQIFRWVADGAPQGDPEDLPKRLKFTSGWQLPREPDLVLNVTEQPFRVQPEGEVKYQWFSVDPKFKEDKWLQAAEILPGNRAVVHHVLAFTRKPGSGKRVSERDGYLVAYVPGLRARPFPKGMAKRIPAGSELVFQVHYTPIGSEQFDQSKIGLLFAQREELTHVVQTFHAVNRWFRIPPKAPAHEVQATTPAAPRDALLLSMMPHMHLRGKSFRYQAQYPDGRKEVLLDVPAYDFNWQTSYRLMEPQNLPKGTRMHCVAQFDNSPRNLNNPDPSATVGWGDQTWDEMMLGYFDLAWPIEQLADEGNVQAEPLAEAKSLIATLDQDDDGKLTRKEVPPKHLVLFFLIDSDRDGVITLSEMTESIKKKRQRESRRQR